MTYKAEIPYGAYWSTPFARWQGSFANLHSVEFAAHVARQELARRKIDPKSLDYGVLGLSVPQNHSFFGMPWLLGMVGTYTIGPLLHLLLVVAVVLFVFGLVTGRRTLG